MLPGQRGHDGQPRYAIPRVPGPGAPPPPGAAAAGFQAAVAAAREAADLEKARLASLQDEQRRQQQARLHWICKEPLMSGRPCGTSNPKTLARCSSCGKYPVSTPTLDLTGDAGPSRAGAGPNSMAGVREERKRSCLLYTSPSPRD